MKRTLKLHLLKETHILKCKRYHLLCAVITLVAAASAVAQSPATIRFDSQTKVFRIDAANQTYAFGINDKSALQPVYWGRRLGATDPLETDRKSVV